jgi:hypothetical protein
MPVIIHDGEDPDAPSVDSIEETERKATDDLASHVTPRDRREERMQGNGPESALDFLDEVEPKADTTVLVELGGLDVLRFG